MGISFTRRRRRESRGTLPGPVGGMMMCGFVISLVGNMMSDAERRWTGCGILVNERTARREKNGMLELGAMLS